MNPSIEVVLFDAVGTLIFPEPSAVEVYAQFGKRHGSTLTLNEIRTRFLKAFQRQEQLDASNRHRTSEDRERQRWQQIVTDVFTELSDTTALFDELYEHFANPQGWRVNQALASQLPTLQKRKLQLGLASNFDQRVRNVIADFAELSPLTHLIISSEVGWKKPAKEFYLSACEIVNRKPEQILFVGDDPENDYRAARAVGMDALLYDASSDYRDYFSSL